MIARPPASPEPPGLYLHFPFCAVRCTYCDFPTVAGQDALVEDYLDALVRELSTCQSNLPSAIDTVFVGGGTPSRMSPRELGRLLQAVRGRFDLPPDGEITVECNPESLDAGKLSGYRDCGVTRVSIGVQTLDDAVLSGVRRAHDAARALEAFELARNVGGFEINADLIVGLPGERLERWSETVRAIAELQIDHVSLYLLESDKDTPLSRSIRAGRTDVADGEALAEAYRETVDILASAGFEQYEVSNFARDGKVSRHNLKYWSDVWYGGFGLGAHGYGDGRRRSNRADLPGYLASLSEGNDPVAAEEPWDPARRLEETLWLGLRLLRGLDLEALGRRYEVDLHRRFETAWSRAEADGLIERDGMTVRLTTRGRIHSNALFSELVGKGSVADA